MKKNYIPPTIEIHQVHVENGYACSFEDRRTLTAGSEGMSDNGYINTGSGGNNDAGNMEGLTDNGYMCF